MRREDLYVKTASIKTASSCLSFKNKIDRCSLLIPIWEMIVSQQHVKGFAHRAKNKRLNTKETSVQSCSCLNMTKIN